MPTETFSFEHILAARERIGSRVHRTPVLTSQTLNARTGNEIFFKCENFQRGGSFKVRGGMSCLTSLSPAEQARGVVAFSSGNHAQGVAIAARDLGIKATIVMPHDAPRSKVEATAHYGAEVISYDRVREDREAIARELAETRGLVLVPPFDDFRIMAGQATAALELLEEVENLDVLLAPVGGGGLLSGCSVAAKQKNPRMHIYGVEAETANDTFLSFQKGERVTIPVPETIADGMRTQAPGELTFPVLQQHVEGILLVTEEEIRAAMRFFLYRMKILVEPTGAVATAALLAHKVPCSGKRIGIIISGGNVDADLVTTL
ncbi:MAG: pyridoxal-phosphate dependent enzyme [Blastocatellia bacterium]|nr:pyridoxal-phosphate dependent enzyme [Blastocatellia bacterium]